jgi:hypothetical protein
VNELPTKSFLGKLENSLTKTGFALLLSVVLLISVAAVSHMNFKTVHHGNEYTMLSEQPFNFEQNNDLQLRILSPLTAYFLFMRGSLFKYFMLAILCFFLMMVYLLFRKKDFSIAESLGMTAILAFSTLSFHQFYFPAYTDPGSYLLILLFLMSYRNGFASTLLLSLMLFNHESTIFLFPFFFLLKADGKLDAGNLLRISLQFVLAFIPYYLYRKFIESHVELNFTLSYYFDPANMQWTRDHVLPNLAKGIFQSFRIAWIIPLVAICIDVYEKRFKELSLMLFVIIFVMLQFFVAYDISRLAGLAFPAIISGSIRMRDFLGTKKFTITLAIIFILNLFIPSYYVGALEPFPYGTGWLNSLFNMYIDN